MRVSKRFANQFNNSTKCDARIFCGKAMIFNFEFRERSIQFDMTMRCDATDTMNMCWIMLKNSGQKTGCSGLAPIKCRHQFRLDLTNKLHILHYLLTVINQIVHKSDLLHLPKKLC